MEENNAVSGRKLLSNTAFYAFADLIGKGLHFILLPIYTAFLTTSDYGIQNMITSFNSVMNYIVLLCLDSAALKFYSEYSNDKEKLKRFYGTAMTIVAAFAFIVVFLCLILRSILERFVFKNIDFVPYVLMGLAVLAFDAEYTLHRRMLEAQQKGKKVATVGLCAVVFSSITTLLMIGVLKLGAFGVLAATLLTSIGTLVFSVVDILKNKMLTVCFDKGLAKNMLKYSLPLIPHQISGYLAALIGRIFLNTTGSLAIVGLYSVATQFSSIVDVFQDATSRAFRPWLFSLLNGSTQIEENRIRNISNILMSLYSVVTVGIGLFAQEIIILMTAESYYGAWKVIPILAVSVSIKSVYYFYFAHCLFYHKTSRFIFIASLTANVINIIAAAILVPLIGMYGSAIASICSITINSIIIYIINLRNEKIGFSLPALVFRLTLSWIFLVVGVLPSYIKYSDGFSIVNAGYKILIMITYLLVIFLINHKAVYEFVGVRNMKSLLQEIRRNRK